MWPSFLYVAVKTDVYQVRIRKSGRHLLRNAAIKQVAELNRLLLPKVNGKGILSISSFLRNQSDSLFG